MGASWGLHAQSSIDQWATTFGGASGDTTVFASVEVDGFLYLTGVTMAADFPVTDATTFQGDPEGIGDIFVAKLDGDGNLVAVTLLGGSGSDFANGIGVTNNFGEGPVLLTVSGWTRSADFPTLNPVQANLAGKSDAVIAQYDADLNLVLSTYLGGAEDDQFAGVVVRANRLVFYGFTNSTDFPFPTPNGQFAVTSKTNPNSSSGLVVTMNANGTVEMATLLQTAASSIYNVVLLGASPFGIAPNRIDAVAFTGWTDHPTFFRHATDPVGQGIKIIYNDIDHRDGARVYSRVISGSGEDIGHAVATIHQRAIIVGQTTSPDFPGVAGGPGPEFGGDTDAVIVALGPLPSFGNPQPPVSAYLGGSGHDLARAIRGSSRMLFNPDNSQTLTAVFAGSTASADLPLPGNPVFAPMQSNFGGGDTDGFFGRLTVQSFTAAPGTSFEIDYLSYLGGPETEGLTNLVLLEESEEGFSAVLAGAATAPVAGEAGAAESEEDPKQALARKVTIPTEEPTQADVAVGILLDLDVGSLGTYPFPSGGLTTVLVGYVNQGAERSLSAKFFVSLDHKVGFEKNAFGEYDPPIQVVDGEGNPRIDVVLDGDVLGVLAGMLPELDPGEAVGIVLPLRLATVQGDFFDSFNIGAAHELHDANPDNNFFETRGTIVAPPPMGSHLWGQVKSGEGDPVPGATVAAVDAEGKAVQAESGISGIYVVSLPDLGTYQAFGALGRDHPGYADWSSSAIQSVEVTPAVPEIRFDPALTVWESNKGRIEGVVFHDRTLNGVFSQLSFILPVDEELTNVTLFLDANANGEYDEGEPLAVTFKDSGEYTFGNLEPGTYRVYQWVRPPWTQVNPETAGVDVEVPVGTVEQDFANRAPDLAVLIEESRPPSAHVGQRYPIIFRVLNYGSLESSPATITVETEDSRWFEQPINPVAVGTSMGTLANGLLTAVPSQFSPDSERMIAMPPVTATPTAYSFEIPSMRPYYEYLSLIWVDTMEFEFEMVAVSRHGHTFRVKVEPNPPENDRNLDNNQSGHFVPGAFFDSPNIRIQRSFGEEWVAAGSGNVAVEGDPAELEVIVDWAEEYDDLVLLQFNPTLDPAGWVTWPGAVELEGGRRVVSAILLDLLNTLDLPADSGHLFVRLYFDPALEPAPPP